MKKPKLVVLTGAGMSAEGGIKTFRDSGGLWEEHDIMEVASPQGWQANPELVLNFYNERRNQLDTVSPNRGHLTLAEMESDFEVLIITQNVDDLHERAGSSRVIHLHGELRKVRSSINPNLVWNSNGDIKVGDRCELGSQVRPHIVWFGEEVPMMAEAGFECQSADLMMVVGTSMAVYPAASLIHFVDDEIPKFLIDPNIPALPPIPNLETISDTAGGGIPKLAARLKKWADER